MEVNDGVRLNIRPFMEADVLPKRPNIKWGTDRGKKPPGSPGARSATTTGIKLWKKSARRKEGDT